MKQTFKYLSMAALVLLGAISVSCNKELDADVQESTPDIIETFTATVQMVSDKTKTIIESNGTHKFKAGDQFAVIYYNGNWDLATSKPLVDANISADGKSATFTVTLKNADKVQGVQYYYPATAVVKHSSSYEILWNSLNTQDGTLDYIASNCDICYNPYPTAWVEGHLPNISLTNGIVIGKFTFKDLLGTAINDDLTSVTISDGTNTYTVTPPSSATTFSSDPIYVAMKPVASDKTISFNYTDGTNNFSKTVTGKTLEMGNIYPINVKAQGTIDLNTVSSDLTAGDGDILTGTLSGNRKISVASGATLTLRDVTINGVDDWQYKWAGITCLGDATIILDGSNTVKGFYNEYPGIYVPSGKTLTIQGTTGSLNASSNGYAAGIGASYNDACGNIVIEGGIITATGGKRAAGIGACYNKACGNIAISGGNVTATSGVENGAGIGGAEQIGGSCGNITISGSATVTAAGSGNGAGIGGGALGNCGIITISGGIVTATGGDHAAGIGEGNNGHYTSITISGGTVTANGGYIAAAIGGGSGGENSGTIGDIIITNTVTKVTATKGSSATYCIGAGYRNTCGTITIGGTVTGNIDTSPYTYQP